MILTFISRPYGPRGRALAALALAILPLACTPGPEEAAAPPAGAAVGELIGVLKLVRQEYANAVAPGGTEVVDATEYAESEIFAEQAEVKVAALRAAGTLAGERAEEVAAGVEAVRAGVTAKVPVETVTRAATGAIARLQDLLAGTVPESIRGAVLATTRADEAIGAEAVAGEYRVGVIAGPARVIYGPAGAAPRDDGRGGAYVGVALRERRTKRFLPAARVAVAVVGAAGRAETELAELWGDFHQYGANLVLPGDGPATVTVRASPPAYARHGDMLAIFVEPVEAAFEAQVRDGVLAFDALPIVPVDPDYAVGDDVLLALAETGGLTEAGPYDVGVIVEAPEPVWTWEAAKPTLEPVGEEATNHVEAVVLDRATGQLLPSASVTMTFLAGARPLETVHLHPLLSVFAHYGRTLALPAGATDVRVRVEPPAIGSLDRPRLTTDAEVTLPLPAARGGAA